MAKKTAACKARSGAILVQPRVYPGLILEVNSGAGRWGPFPAYFIPQRLGQGPFLGRTFWANAAINSAWRRAAPWWGTRAARARRPISSRFPGWSRRSSDGLGQGRGVVDHNPGAGLFQNLLGPAEIFADLGHKWVPGPRPRASRIF